MPVILKLKSSGLSDIQAGGGERRTFTVWAADPKTKEGGPKPGEVYSFPSTELRCVNVEMQLLPPVGGVPLRTVRRGNPRASALAARQNFQVVTRRLQEQRADPPEPLWEISAGSERLALDRCW